MLTADEQARWLEDLDTNSQILGPLGANWVSDTLRIADLVAREVTDVTPVFWLRLYGVLADVSELVDKHRALAADPNVAAWSGVNLDHLDKLRKAIDGLAAVFDEDDLVYMQYRRHTEAHPWQNNYRLKRTKKGLKDGVHQRLLGRPMKQSEWDACLNRVLAKYDGEHLIAIDFAQRSLPLLPAVDDAASLYFTAR